MSRPLRRVGLCFGRMDHWHHGLGEFARQLGHALAAQAPRLREVHGIELHFHLARRWHGFFGDEVRYLSLWDTERFVHVERHRFDVWHTLHQHIRFRPPVGARHRLLTLHDLNYLYFKRADKIAKYSRRMQRLLDRQTAVVAISDYVRTDLQRHLSCPSAPSVVYNGATDLNGAPQAPVPDLTPGAYLLHLSRMASTKNVGCLIDLAACMPAQQFVFAGPAGVDADAVKAQITERGLRNARVVLDVSEAEKAWLLAHCRGFLFPSLAEGFGLPPLEAMNFGKPVFLSRLTSLPEVGGDVAYYFDRFDREHLREVVEHGLADHPQPGRDQAIRAHAARFTWAACAEAYVAQYLALMDADGR